MVLLVDLPPGFIDDLPLEEQVAIRDMVGKAVRLLEITTFTFRGERVERAELEFSSRISRMNHTLFVDPRFIRTLK